jgi:hypothetical protein
MVVLFYVKDADLPPTANPAITLTLDDLEDDDERDGEDEERAADDVLVKEGVTVMGAAGDILVVDEGPVNSDLSAGWGM